VLIRNLRLIDGTGAVLDGVDVRVREGRFVEVGAGLEGDATLLDAAGATAIPGLVDAHTHLSLDATTEAFEHATGRSHAYQALGAAQRAEALLAHGVTTARDVGGVAPVVFGLRDAVNDGLARGPRIFAAGHWLTATGGHGWPVGREADGPDAVRRAVREELKAGADLIKLMASGGVVGPGLGPNAVQFSEEEVRIAAAEAHGAAKTLAAHAHGVPALANAIRGGVDTVEHGSYLTEQLVAEMLERGTFLVPTLAVVQLILKNAEAAGLLGHTLERAQEVAASHRTNVAAAYRAGVPIVAGTDMGTPFTHPDTLHRELEELVAIGLPPLEAIEAGTRRGALALGLADDLGSVEPGRRADLVVLEGGADPLADITATRRIRHVLRDGEVVVREGGLVLGEER
jgi:imidazolonepropionase-like amidohydrolase